jgi:hypothetical protein
MMNWKEFNGSGRDLMEGKFSVRIAVFPAEI